MELQVQIDDVSACPGRCPGCILSADERKTNKADLPDESRAVVLARIKEYAQKLQPERLNVSWGIADHMMLGADYVKALYRETASMAIEAGYEGSCASVAFSTSLIANQKVAKEQIHALSSMERLQGIELIPIVVLDPQNLRHKTFGPQWHAYAEMAHKAFRRIDLTMNLSDVACHLMPPDELVHYINEYGFREVTINWTPTLGNIAYTAMDMQGITRWLLEFAKLSDAAGVHYSYGPSMLRVAQTICNRPEQGSLVEEALRAVNVVARHAIHVDADGSLYPLFEMVGDGSHSPRFEYEPIGNVLTESIGSILDRSMEVLARRIIREVMTDSRCRSCKFVRSCNMMGFHVYTHVLATKEKQDKLQNTGAKPYGSAECPHIAKALWEYTFSKVGTE